jgi:hypothetical protein
MDTNTTIKTVAKGDCFLCIGDKCGTLYYITEARDNKCKALSIFIDQSTVQALEYEDEYYCELSDDIIMLPSSMYDTIKQLMLNCVNDVHKILEDEALEIDFELKPGTLFTNGTDIYTAKEIKDGCWHFDLFRFDEEFVSNSTEFETVEEYRNSIKDRLTKEANDRADIELDNDILDKIIDDTIVEIPDAMTEDEFNRQLRGMEGQMRYQGITIEDYVKYIGKTVEEFKEDIKKSATRNVKARLVLEKLIRSEKLDITEEDIDNKLAEMAKNVGKDVEEYKKQVNNDMVNSIANELLMKKLLNFLHENNEIK